jgi:hypothetical protein
LNSGVNSNEYPELAKLMRRAILPIDSLLYTPVSYDDVDDALYLMGITLNSALENETLYNAYWFLLDLHIYEKNVCVSICV